MSNPSANIPSWYELKAIQKRFKIVRLGILLFFKDRIPANPFFLMCFRCNGIPDFNFAPKAKDNRPAPKKIPFAIAEREVWQEWEESEDDSESEESSEDEAEGEADSLDDSGA